MSQSDIYALVADQLWSLLDSWRLRAQAALAALEPDASVAGTVLDGRLLRPVRLADTAQGDPVISVLTSALAKALSEADGSPVRLQGFDPGGGAPRGLALVLRDEANVAVAALTGAGPRGLAFEIAALGAGAWGPLTLPLQNGWSLDVSAQAGARLQLPRGAAPSLIDAGAPATLKGTLRHAGQPMRLGPDAGPHLDLSSVALAVQALASNGLPQVSYVLDVSGAQLSLAPGPLAAVLGDALALPLDVSLAADPQRGLSFGPGGLKLNLPVSLSLPGVDIDAVQLSVDSDGPRLRLGAGLSFTAGLAGLPLSLSATGLGASMPVNLGSGALGVDPAGVQALMPTGIGMALELPLFGGGGFVQNTAPGAYAGLLELSLGVMAVDAFGLLQLPTAGVPLGFVALVAVALPAARHPTGPGLFGERGRRHRRHQSTPRPSGAQRGGVRRPGRAVAFSCRRRQPCAGHHLDPEPGLPPPPRAMCSPGPCCCSAGAVGWSSLRRRWSSSCPTRCSSPSLPSSPWPCPTRRCRWSSWS